MHAFLSKSAIARRLDVDPRKLNRVLSEAGIMPDSTNGRGKLFRPDRVGEIRARIGKGRK
jgi:hypothetical protein